MTFLAVGLGGFLGAISRYGIALLLTSKGLVGALLATLSVNVLGSFGLGLLTITFGRAPSSYGPMILFLTTGFLGGFTTFSAFGSETVTLMQRQDFGMAALNVGANLLLGFAAIWLGRAVG